MEKDFFLKTKEILCKMKHWFHEANPNSPKVKKKKTDCDTIDFVNGCESSEVERNRPRGFLVQRRTST